MEAVLSALSVAAGWAVREWWHRRARKAKADADAIKLMQETAVMWARQNFELTQQVHSLQEQVYRLRQALLAAGIDPDAANV